MNWAGEGTEQTPPPNAASEADNPQGCTPDQPTGSPRNSPVSPSAPAHLLESQGAAADSTDSTEKWTLNVFRQVEERLTGKVTMTQIQHLPLFFLEPPSQTEALDDSTPVLDQSEPLNSLALEHEQWLNHHHQLFENFAQRYQSDPRLSLQVATITRKLEKEMKLLKKAKILERKRQLAAMAEAEDQLVDCRE